MELKTYISKTSNVFGENRLLKIVVILMLCIQLVNAYMMKEALQNQRTILTPPQITQKMWISGNKASDEYLKEFGRFIASLAFNYTMGTARQQFSELMTMYRPAEYENAKKTFYDLADKIEESRATGVFYITKMYNDPEKKWLELEGIKRTFVAEKQVEDSRKHYIIQYDIEGGKLVVIRIADFAVAMNEYRATQREEAKK